LSPLGLLFSVLILFFHPYFNAAWKIHPHRENLCRK
jgi:hypothetical protein